MKKKPLIVLCLIVFGNYFMYGQSARNFSVQEMRDDIDTLVSYLEATHINPYYRYPKKDFYNAVRAAKSNLRKPLNLIDFYLMVQPVIARLEDGHTDIKPPMWLYSQSNPFVLPYDFKLSPSKPYIRCARSSFPGVDEIPAGAEIASINNVPAKKIVDDIISLNTGETKAFRADFGTNYFDFYLESLYKPQGIYRVGYIYNNDSRKVVVNGIRQQAFTERLRHYHDSVSTRERAGNSFYSLALLPEIKTAIIDLQSFEDPDQFNLFIDSAFIVIKNNGIKNLVIDIREDAGGDSDIGDAFLQYIAKTPFRQYAKVLEKHSPLLKERLRSHRIGKIMSSEDSTLLNTPDNTFRTQVYEDIPLKSTSFRFAGNIYLLTSSYTFSSAADFAQCIKHYKLGTIVGDETGGLIVSYGDIVTTRLPHTQLTFTISSKLYYNMGARENDWRGVVPDVKMPAEQAKKYVLKLIHEKGNYD
jgi:hypothetical protein